MIPWNPIHRYSGMTSQFDSLDGVGQGEVATARAGDWSSSPSRSVTERRPLGFVDVRAESSPTGDGTGEPPGLHAIVMENAKRVWDPHPKADWDSELRIVGETLFVVTDPARLTARVLPVLRVA